MKYLQDYINDEQTRVFEKYDAFFAFSKKQFEEGKKEGMKYVALDSGLIAPKENIKNLFDALEDIHNKGVKKDIAENGISSIIQRELSNHEAQITMGISDTVDALDGYNITEDQIKEEYNTYFALCVKNDWF